MARNTPSGRRRLGREAFEPGTDPMDVQPYARGTWAYDAHLPDWLEGWNEAKRAYDEKFGFVQTVECKWCGMPTDATAIQECANCWEMRTRMERDIELAEKIFEAVKKEKENA